MNASTNKQTTFSGWWRASKRDRWQRIVTDAASYDSAWGQLLDALADRRAGESMVLSAEANPNTKRRF